LIKGIKNHSTSLGGDEINRILILGKSPDGRIGPLRCIMGF